MRCGPRAQGGPDSTLVLGPHASWSAFLNQYSLHNKVSSHCLGETQELTEATLAGWQWVCRLLREMASVDAYDHAHRSGAWGGRGAARLASQAPGTGTVLCLKPSLSHGWERLGPTGTQTGSPRLP